jgi:hypothetical protein
MYTKGLIGTVALISVVTAAPFEELVTRSCAAQFKNTVFNSGVNNEPDFSGRFRTLQASGVSGWIGFTLDNAGPGDANLDTNQIKMVLTADQVQPGVSLVTSANPPQYLQLLNEPDADFYGQPIIAPEDAPGVLAPILQTQTTTTFLSSAPAFPGSDWLPRFFTACNCDDRFPIVLAHVYNPDPQAAIQTIQGVQGQFPNKKIWITEISPASNKDQGCNLDQQGVIDWMNTVIGWVSQQEQIERVFWNSGEYVNFYISGIDLGNRL